jgi:hypothetical protein
VPSAVCWISFFGGTVACSIAARLFIATAVDTTVLALLSRIALYCPPQNGVRGKAVAARRILNPIAIAGDLGGKTLTPGTFNAGAAITLAGDLVLDAQNAAAAVAWDFTIGGAFTTAAASTIEIINDTNNVGTVTWDVVGAITTGAGSTAIGFMKASGAITVGANAEVGELDAGGAITLGAGATSGVLNAGGAITVGAGATSGVASATGAVTVGAGASAGTFIPSDMGGTTFLPGDYTAAAAVGLTGDVTLDNTADNGVWTFEIAAALTTAAGSKMLVTGGATYTVTWIVAGAITTGANSEAIGIMQTTAGAVTVGAGATVETIDAVGAVTLGAGATVTGDVASAGAITFGAGASAFSVGGATAVTLAVGASAPGYLPADLGGLSPLPTTYTTPGANTLTGVLTLNGPGHWIFDIGGAFSVAAAARVDITGGATVEWIVNGAIALGAGAQALGSMRATGAITLGAGATSQDLEATGAIGLGAAAHSGVLVAGGAIALGAGATATSAVAGGALTLGAGATAPAP